MRTLNRPDLHTGTANHSRRRSTRTGVRASQRSNIELASDGVLASYIHDIQDATDATSHGSRGPMRPIKDVGPPTTLLAGPTQRPACSRRCST
jgi:hypothetical protein